MALKIRTRDDSFEITVRGVRFEVSPLSTREKDKLFRDFTTTKWERGQRFESLRGQEASCELFVRTIKNWGPDIVDEDNNCVPCNQETKRNFYQRNITLANEIIEKAEEAASAITEIAAKNLRTGEDGISPQYP
jgi:translation initiation factor 2B subunit (eIF-2B alpha/beta/delta family)